ncbi:branched-chain amino acid ABC transporter permease/ATP-binding protein [Sporichthya brevicatena]|uniref:Branched-chain amino acid ABC transporter permease/ATP-binding protein n=1 Tax=Sporichthya brevicatena TaxID=171442 RepID=A0ABN1HAM7_9ACTN
METYARFAILGMATGSLYALTALGIVLVYRASGVLNFAAGATGAFGAFVAYDLRDTHDVQRELAMAIGIAAGAVIGVLTQIIVMTLLSRAAPVAKLIATLGILTILVGAIELIWGEESRGQPRSLLVTTRREVLPDVFVPQDRLVLIGIALVAAVILRLLYSATPFGLATAAVAENRRVAAISGLSATRIELANFAIAGAISAAAAILLAPVLGLDINALTAVVIPALAAALIGRFASFGVTVLAALAIGVVQAEIPQLGFVKDHPEELAGLPTAVPVLLIVLVTAIRGRGRLQRGELIARLPLPGTGRIRPELVAAALVVGLLATSTANAAWAGALTITVAIAIVILSVVVVTGYAGQLSLAQFAIAGFGLWVAARLYDTQGLLFPFALLAGVALAVPLGLLVALPALRARGVDLAVATLGLAIAVQAIVLGNTELTGGYSGTTVKGADIFGWSIDGVAHPNRYASVGFVLLIVTGLVVANLRRGRSGRRLLAVRSNERAAASLGVGVYGAKLYAFGLSAAIAGLGGVVLGFKDQAVRFDQFNIFGSINVVQYAVIGGLGSIGGAAIGATLAVGAVGSRLLTDLVSDPDTVTWITILASLQVIVLIRHAPDGLGAQIADLGRRLPGLSWGRSATSAADVARREREFRALDVQNLTVRFGGVVALDGVSFTVRPGEVVGLIGPNGAGKTTLLDVVTGFTKPAAGSINLGGQPIDRWSPERRAREGIGRSFQAVELFEELTVEENLLVAADRQAPWRYLTDLVRPGRQVPSDAMAGIVSLFELEAVLQQRPAELSQGQARLVGIARAMCAEPTLLFLDEPAAGLDSHEREELGQAVRSLAAANGIGVVLVEHDVPLVMATCDRIVALDFGRVIATGTPDEIRAHPDVVASYLGEEAHA